ncbi:MAG: PilZ domain-containing protein [Alphaproteobacteria bacterium]|nr:PilZ domain-containing protein [Alphaproteobacteria bacterium]
MLGVEGEGTGGGGCERRRHERAPLLSSGSLHKDDGVVDCVIKDISASGARLKMERRITEQKNLVLDIDGVGLFPSRIAWQREDEAGIQFLSDPSTVASWIGAAWSRFAFRV